MSHGGGEQFFLGCFVAIEFTADATFMQHQDAIAHPDQLRQLARDEHDRFAGVGQLIDNLVDFQLGADVDAA